jgi:methyl-accepting chemotaxis protein
MTVLSHAQRGAQAAPPGVLGQMLATRRPRRSYLVHPKTQFAITRQFIVLLLTASGLSVGNYHVLRTMLAVDAQDRFSIAMAYGYAGLMLIVSVFLLFLLCVLVSHRIAGPANRISHALDRMAQGDLCVHVKLRDADLLTELAEAVNAVNRDLRTALDEVDSELRRARSLRGDPARLDACLQRAERALSGFQIRNSEELRAQDVPAGR